MQRERKAHSFLRRYILRGLIVLFALMILIVLVASLMLRRQQQRTMQEMSTFASEIKALQDASIPVPASPITVSEAIGESAPQEKRTLDPETEQQIKTLYEEFWKIMDAFPGEALDPARMTIGANKEQRIWLAIASVDWKKPETEFVKFLDQVIPLYYKYSALLEPLPNGFETTELRKLESEYTRHGDFDSLSPFPWVFLKYDALRMIYGNNPKEAFERINLYLKHEGYISNIRKGAPREIDQIRFSSMHNGQLADFLSTFIEHYPEQDNLDLVLQTIHVQDPDGFFFGEALLSQAAYDEEQISKTLTELSSGGSVSAYPQDILNWLGEIVANNRRRSQATERYHKLQQTFSLIQPHLNKPLPALLSALKSIPGTNGSEIDYSFLFYSFQTDEIQHTLSSIAYSVNECNACVIKVALISFRNAHGSFPDSLDALASEMLPFVPVDAFTGKPFIYRRTDSGYILYSPGVDLTDNGGTPPAQGQNAWQDGVDQVFSYNVP